MGINKTGFRTILAGMAISLLQSCGGNNAGDGSYPSNFTLMSDGEKVAWMMHKCTPDSVARFIINSALELNGSVRIDTFQNAVLYAYETYRNDSLTFFAEEFDNYSSSLPLDKKMQIYNLAAKTDPMGLGYQLGLEYVEHLRENIMNLSAVDAEIEAFRKACASDTDTYRRFLKGLSTALSVDDAPGIPEDVKIKYIR